MCNDYGCRSECHQHDEGIEQETLKGRGKDQHLVFFYKIVYDLVAAPATDLPDFNQRQKKTFLLKDGQASNL